MNEKITDTQLQRAAYIYVRQSTLQQVRNNIESNRRQYELEGRARQLGFQTVIVIDDDLGISGSGSRERPGFARLLSAVCNGEVGAVFALEASRLARNNRDWHHLIDLCVLTDTLVVDDEGVYDPRQLNDRLLLGLKGTMSEFELGILRQRAQEAYRQKVMRGEVLTRVPVGFVRQDKTGIAITPDLEIQQAIRTLFSQFDCRGSLRQVHLWYHEQKLNFPTVRYRHGSHHIDWQLPNYQHLLRAMKNPTYAGAFAWGKSGSRTTVVAGRSQKTGGHKLPMEQWQVLIKDHHPGYLTWENYMDNQQKLTANRTRSHQTSTGAAKKGSALLAGLLRCVQCGHKLHVAYRGKNGRAARYFCLTGNKEQGSPSCLSFGGIKVENAVADLVLKACQPLGVKASLNAFEGQDNQRVQKRRALELSLERLRYQAAHARRQYDAVDPANRLVASELEARWNEALTAVGEAEALLLVEPEPAHELTKDQREQLQHLGQNLRSLWDHPAASLELKKRILRSVIEEIIVDISQAAGNIEIQIHWKGGVHTPLRAHKNKVGVNTNATDKTIAELVGEMAKAWTDKFIASQLNRLGLKTGKGNNWSETRVKNLRRENNIPVHSKALERTWKTMEEAAEILEVSATTTRTMIRNNILPARQIIPGSPWMIETAELTTDAIQNHLKQIKTGKTPPREVDHPTLNL